MDLCMANVYNIGTIYRVCEYHPYRRCGERNPDCNDDTYRIMDLKNPDAAKHKIAIAHYTQLLDDGFGRIANFLQTPYLQVAIVPSSKKGKVSQGLESILSQITKTTIIYDRDFLVRDCDVPSAHEGGDRSIEKHINSISVKRIPNTEIPLILLDDVTTSGNSLKSCKTILEKAGINNIYMVAIGSTV